MLDQAYQKSCCIKKIFLHHQFIHHTKAHLIIDIVKFIGSMHEECSVLHYINLLIIFRIGICTNKNVSYMICISKIRIFQVQTKRNISDIYNWFELPNDIKKEEHFNGKQCFSIFYTYAQMTDLDWLWLLIFNEQWAAYISLAPSYIRKSVLRIFGYWHIGSKVTSTNSTESPSNIEGVTGFSVMLQYLELYMYIYFINKSL